MSSQVTIFWETVGGIWETVLVPKNTLKNTGCSLKATKDNFSCSSLNAFKEIRVSSHTIIKNDITIINDGQNLCTIEYKKVCKTTSVTHTKRIYRNLLRKETSFVCYTSSVLRKSRPNSNRIPGIFHCAEIYFIIQDFEQLAVALKTEKLIFFLPWKTDIFHCIWTCIFIIQDLWATSACPEKQSCPEILCCMEYTFYILNFWATCACPEKQRVAWIYCIEYIFFIIQEFWATRACPENRVCPEIFQARGGGRPPRPPASYAYGYNRPYLRECGSVNETFCVWKNLTIDLV